MDRKLKHAVRNGCSPKVLVPVHLCGTSCAMEPISALAHYYGVAVVEDASHAIGGHYQDKSVSNFR